MVVLKRLLETFPGPVALVKGDGKILAASKDFRRLCIGKEETDATAYDLLDLPLLARGEGEKILEFLGSKESESKEIPIKTVIGEAIITRTLKAKKMKVGGEVAHIIHLKEYASLTLEELQDDFMIYYRLAESASVAGIILLQNWRISFANPYVEKETGYGREELQGMNILELFPKEEGKKVEEHLHFVEKHGGSVSDTLRYLKKNRELGWATFSFSSWKEQDTQVSAVAFFDTSDKMKLRDELEEFKDKFRATLSTTPDVFMEVNLKGEVLELSAPRDDPLSSVKSEGESGRFPGFDRSDFLRFLKEATEEVKIKGEGTFIYRTKVNGFWRYYEGKSAAVSKRVIFIFRNVTDSVRMRNILQCANNVNNMLLTVEKEKNLYEKVIRELSGGDIIKCMWICLRRRDGWKLTATHPALITDSLQTDICEKGLGDSSAFLQKALKTKSAVVIKHGDSTPSKDLYRFWENEKGLEVILPMLHSGEALGLISLYMVGVEDIHEEELNVLQAMANNLAFAVMDMEADRMLRSAYSQLKENLIRFENIADKIRNPLMVAEGLNYLFERRKITPEQYYEKINVQLKNIEMFLERLREEETRSYIIKEDLAGK